MRMPYCFDTNGKNNEWDRIMREYKEQQQADLLYQLKIKKNENKEGNAK